MQYYRSWWDSQYINMDQTRTRQNGFHQKMSDLNIYTEHSWRTSHANYELTQFRGCVGSSQTSYTCALQILWHEWTKIWVWILSKNLIDFHNFCKISVRTFQENRVRVNLDNIMLKLYLHCNQATFVEFITNLSVINKLTRILNSVCAWVCITQHARCDVYVNSFCPLAALAWTGSATVVARHSTVSFYDTCLIKVTFVLLGRTHNSQLNALC